MALIVETGSGVAGANSYISLVDADIYAAGTNFRGAWDDLSDPDKESRLIEAALLMDQTANYKGYKTYSSGTLRWPRSGVSDLDGIEIPSNSIPFQLKNAQMEMAFTLSLGTDPNATPETLGVKELQVDVIGIKFTDDMAAGLEKKPLPDKVLMWLRGLIVSASIRGLRFGQLIPS